MVKDTVLKTIGRNNLISKGDCIIVGLSGGPDSLSLFDVLMSIKKEKKLTLEVVHVNHMLRQGAADEDQHFVETLCANNGIRCWTFCENCNVIAKKYSMSTEEAGRKLRYDAFVKVARTMIKEGMNPDKIKIAIAHNLNDQAETLLFRLIRGTGTDGLAGMDYIRRDRSGFIIIRPLLDVKREEVEEYCRKRKLEPRVDDTNSQPIYTRNKIRLELIPYLRDNFNSNITEALTRLCMLARDDTNYISRQADKAWEEIHITGKGSQCVLKRDLLKSRDPAIRHRIILRAFEEAGLFRDITFAHIEQADKLIGGRNASGRIDFPHGFTLSVSYNRVKCSSPVEKKPVVEQHIKARILYIQDYMKIPNTACFDMDQLSHVYDFAGGPLSMIVARTREPGDYMQLAVGRKSIQDMMVDMKVPRELRDTIYMAAIGNEILWIPDGVSKERFTENYKVTEDTKKVLILEIEHES